MAWLPVVRWKQAALLAALACACYLHLLWQPFLEDDYIQIDLGRDYGPAARWGALAADVLYRSRATSIWLTHATEALFGVSAPVFYVTMALIHWGNAWLVRTAALGAGLPPALAFGAAAYFTVQAGHQEAVMWYAALPELLVFTFVLLFLISWMQWVGGSGTGPAVLAVVFFTLALLSKESAVVAVPLAGLVNARARPPLSRWLALGALALLCGLYAWAIFAARDRHLHLNDGTFSFAAPFPLTFRNSVGRLLWVWGAVSLAAFAATRQWRRWRQALVVGGVWMAVTLLPYIFLTYMPRVPSRHTYLASAGLAVIVAAGMISVTEALTARVGRAALAAGAVAAVVLGSEAAYLWMAKRPQILARAEPTEALVRFAGRHQGPIYLRCFPTSYLVAESALRIVLHWPAGSVIVDPAQAGDAPAFCHTEERR